MKTNKKNYFNNYFKKLELLENNNLYTLNNNFDKQRLEYHLNPAIILRQGQEESKDLNSIKIKMFLLFYFFFSCYPKLYLDSKNKENCCFLISNYNINNVDVFNTLNLYYLIKNKLAKKAWFLSFFFNIETFFETNLFLSEVVTDLLSDEILVKGKISSKKF